MSASAAVAVARAQAHASLSASTFPTTNAHNPAPAVPANVHESLMGSMMARSTPRVLFFSRHVRRTITLLEVLAALIAFSLLATLCVLHIRFVRSDGCAPLLQGWDLAKADQPDTEGTAQVIEIAAQLNDFSSVARFRFSQERGLLLLSDRSLKALNVTVAHIPLATTDRCLGDAISRFVLLRVIGYETVVINAFARMRRRIKRPDGYVLSLQTRRVLNLMHADPGLATEQMHVVTRVSLRIIWKCGAVMTAVFIMCTTGALVAFTLKEVQLRMIKLTMDLFYVMRSQLGYSRVIVRYAMDALVFVPIVAGMLFFLFEFFDDQALAFVVLMLTWLCEFAASGSTRHQISRQYLPRLFFCYFGAFHVYFFSFPLGFSWLALATSLVFMVHAALAIWNHCELPLLRRERDNPAEQERRSR